MHIPATFATLCYGMQWPNAKSCTTRPKTPRPGGGFGGFWGVFGGSRGGGPPKWPFFGIFPFFGEFARKFMTRRWKNHRRHKFLDEFFPRTQKKYFCDGKILRPTFRGENFSARKTFPTNLPKPRAQKSDKMCTRKIWQICQKCAQTFCQICRVDTKVFLQNLHKIFYIGKNFNLQIFFKNI